MALPRLLEKIVMENLVKVARKILKNCTIPPFQNGFEWIAMNTFVTFVKMRMKS